MMELMVAQIINLQTSKEALDTLKHVLMSHSASPSQHLKILMQTTYDGPRGSNQACSGSMFSNPELINNTMVSIHQMNMNRPNPKTSSNFAI